jgi:hypothetical protein
MDASNFNGESLLRALGLERTNSTDWIAPVTGALAVGLAVGGVLGLLLAPKSGNELRQDLRRRYDEAKGDIGSAVKKATEVTQETAVPDERSTRY